MNLKSFQVYYFLGLFNKKFSGAILIDDDELFITLLVHKNNFASFMQTIFLFDVRKLQFLNGKQNCVNTN